MKKLRFLVAYPYNTVTEKLVGYLVESGHQVSVISSIDSALWLVKYYYNLKLIEPAQIDHTQYDYMLSADQSESIHFPLLHISLNNRVPELIECAICLHSQRKSFQLCASKIICSNKKLEKIYDEITEIFIDAIIYLARSQTNNGNSFYDCNCSSLLEIFQLEEELEKLNTYYEVAEKSHDEKFMLRHLFNDPSFRSLQGVVAVKDVCLAHPEVECLLIFLLGLLNARRESLFHYDFSFAGGQIKKYVHFIPSLTYDGLLKQLSDPVYGVAENNFFCYSSAAFQRSEILFAINNRELDSLQTSDDYLVVFHYDPSIKNLTITYQKKMYFFDKADEYLSYFLAKFNDWKEGACEAYDILYTDTSLYEKQLYEWNSNISTDFEGKTVHELFEDQVKKTPDNLALVYEQVKLTYAELNQKANQLAHFLIKKYEIKPDDLIALYLDRSEYIVIAILAVLKSGGAYLPIQINSEQINSILRETKTRIILTNENRFDYIRKAVDQKILDNLEGILTIDDLEISSGSIFQGVNLKNQKNHSGNLAYALYTSGTSSDPKCVMVEHASLVNFSNHHSKLFQETDKILGYINYSFDAVNTEIFPSLLFGRPLYLVGDELRINLDRLLEYIKKTNITVAILPAIVASEITLNSEIKFTKLRLIITGGDIYHGKLDIDNLTVINAFGPTEVTTCSSLHIYKSHDLRANIGRPISNVQCYVLDKNLKLLPEGVIGELHVGGLGLARGYLGNETLTKEKFILTPLPIQSQKHIPRKFKRLYKTGDLVRWLSNGDIEYIGRNDFQVKILGYRINLEEIQNKIYSYGGIRQSVVTVHQSGGSKYLIGYYWADLPINEESVLDYLSLELPEYMVPAKLVKLGAIPLTFNGKLDKDRIPAPESLDAVDFFPPSRTEKIVCNIFGGVLNIKNVGVNDNFFRLGGNSMSAIRLAVKLKDYFDVRVNQIFNFPTPRELSKKINPNKNNLISRLELIKKMYYDASIHRKSKKNTDFISEMNDYLSNISAIHFDSGKKNKVCNVLLTGSTGYFGCNLFYQLLFLTDCKIFLLLRGVSKSVAFKRLSEKFSYYFNLDLEKYKDRFSIYLSDLESKCMGLGKQDYEAIAKKVDSVIHAAALVKHYGEYKRFYDANVQATLNLLEFCLLTRGKDFHYISTTAPLAKGTVRNRMGELCTEMDDFYVSDAATIYDRTKFESERIAIRYRKYGLKSNIYRIGNLAFMLVNGCLQQNIDHNAFYNWIKCLLEMGQIAKEISAVDVSPADLVAKAVVLLFDKSGLNNTTFHVFNPHAFELTGLKINDVLVLSPVSIDDFIDHVIQLIRSGNYERIERFLLHQGWLEGVYSVCTCRTELRQDKTSAILNKCGFNWYPIPDKIFVNYVKKIIERSEDWNGKASQDI